MSTDGRNDSHALHPYAVDMACCGYDAGEVIVAHSLDGVTCESCRWWRTHLFLSPNDEDIPASRWRGVFIPNNVRVP